MTISAINRYALGSCVAAAVLAGCGYPNASTAPPVNAASESLPHHKTFDYTGARQSFVVPDGVTKVTIVAVGARGGGVEYEDRDIQALGGRVRAIIPVTPGEKLAVFVGGQGSRSNGGFNGGGSGAGAPSCCEAYGGGGASDVRQGGDRLKDRVLVAGGGGGEESFGSLEYGGLGGKGGYGGGGGTQSGGVAGGNGGSGSYPGPPGSAGSLDVGGSGGQGGVSSYAGGGGGGGGGGGSSYIESSAYAGRTWEGWRIHTTDGLVVFDW